MDNLLFDELKVEIMQGMTLLPRYANSDDLMPSLEKVLESSPLRQMETSRGFKMSVHTSNCGDVGWVSDRQGYRYVGTDPITGTPWHPMPDNFFKVAQTAAAKAGFANFSPDACLINRYCAGTQMGLHQDKDESDFSQPVVSVSLGITARFYVTGMERRGPSTSVDLTDGDVLVFGNEARLYYHGVRKIKPSTHPRIGEMRWNLTFRKAL